MRGLVFACITFAAAMPAQDAAARNGDALVDAVVATVNDGAIMWTELRTVAAGYIRTAAAMGQLTPRDYEELYQRALEDLINKHRLAQAVKTFGVFTPEQIEMFIERELARQEREQLRDFGSYPAYMNALKVQGQTWPTFKNEQRVDIMARFAREFAVYMRLQKQSNLYLTPRMLRETYERERHLFVHGAMARVAMVVFRGDDARAAAERAAAEWREQEIDAQQLAARYPGAIASSELAANSLAPGLSAITTFALAGPVGNVSAPIESDGAFRIAKVTAHRPERNGKFEDPAVQDELRVRCERKVQDEFLQQALERAEMRTEVWRSPLLTRGRRRN